MNTESKLLEALLSADAFIQVNKKLIKELGLHEAILVAELYSERKYWREHNGTIFKENENGVMREYWYSTRENLEENTGLTPYYQRDALNNLETAGIIESRMMNVPARKHYAIVDSQLLKALTASDETVLQLDGEGFNDINKNKNIKINNKSTGAGASSKKHPRNFDKKTLTDELSSGKDIAEQTKKKSPKDKFREECLDIIDDEYSEKNYSYAVKDLLTEYFDFVSDRKQATNENKVKVVSSVGLWKDKLAQLDELVKQGYDPLDIVQQSLEQKKYKFFPLKSDSSSNVGHKFETKQGEIKIRDLEEAKKAMQDKIARGVEVF